MTVPAGLGRLLIVDDELPVLEVLSEFFATQGYSVRTATSGAEALEAARREPPHLVLLDVRMPGMDGLEVLRRLREQDASIAVIMVTANEDVGLARETLKIGAFDYVAKPFDFGYLDRAVSAALVHLGAGDAAPAAVPGDPWTRLAVDAFRVARPLAGPARDSIGRRLEDLALAALREVEEGRTPGALAALRQIEVLLRVATEMGDLTAADCAPLEAAVADAFKAAAG